MFFLKRNVDYMNIMTYDYHGGWDTRTNHHAPLYAERREAGLDGVLNVVSRHDEAYHLVKSRADQYSICSRTIQSTTGLIKELLATSSFLDYRSLDDHLLSKNQIKSKQDLQQVDQDIQGLSHRKRDRWHLMR